VNADWFVPALAAHVPRLAAAYEIDCRLESQDRVGLTFDDGPHPAGTPAVLDELARHGASATFFLVGEQVAKRPALAREIVDAGFEADTRCIAVSRVTRPDERIVETTLQRLPELATLAGPVLLLVGVLPAKER